MVSQPLHSPQANPPLPPKAALPTMHGLPSEQVGEPGWPDEYHYLQPRYDAAGNWLPTRAERLAERLRELGVDPDTV